MPSPRAFSTSPFHDLRQQQAVGTFLGEYVKRATRAAGKTTATQEIESTQTQTTKILDGGAQKRFASALERLTGLRTDVLSKFAGAEKPLAEAKAVYAPGGTYGQGAKTRISREMQEALARAMTSLAQTGMHSGSLAEGVRARFGREKAEALQGVEDVRADRFTDVMKSISGLRAGSGSILSQMREPSWAAAVGPQGTETTGVSTQKTTTKQPMDLTSLIGQILG